MDDHAAAGTQLFDNDLNDIAEHIAFSLRIVRPASSDEVLELGRA